MRIMYCTIGLLTDSAVVDVGKHLLKDIIIGVHYVLE